MNTGTVEIKHIDEHHIEILGVSYCTESYLKEMMGREFSRGYDKGATVHVAHFEEPPEEKDTWNRFKDGGVRF